MSSHATWIVSLFVRHSRKHEKKLDFRGDKNIESICSIRNKTGSNQNVSIGYGIEKEQGDAMCCLFDRTASRDA